ncbi:hypothetical protein D3C72_2270160 [compost metagenome]
MPADLGELVEALFLAPSHELVGQDVLEVIDHDHFPLRLPGGADDLVPVVRDVGLPGLGVAEREWLFDYLDQRHVGGLEVAH